MVVVFVAGHSDTPCEWTMRKSRRGTDSRGRRKYDNWMRMTNNPYHNDGDGPTHHPHLSPYILLTQMRIPMNSIYTLALCPCHSLTQIQMAMSPCHFPLSIGYRCCPLNKLMTPQISELLTHFSSYPKAENIHNSQATI